MRELRAHPFFWLWIALGLAYFSAFVVGLLVRSLGTTKNGSFASKIDGGYGIRAVAWTVPPPNINHLAASTSPIGEAGLAHPSDVLRSDTFGRIMLAHSYSAPAARGTVGNLQGLTCSWLADAGPFPKDARGERMNASPFALQCRKGAIRCLIRYPDWLSVCDKVRRSPYFW
jgi:hypothetical protein